MFKDLRSGQIIYKKRAKLSNFFPDVFRKLIEKLPDDEYVLGVGYKSGDFQVGVTGKSKERESLMDAASRELCEETRLTGLVPTNKIKENVFMANIKNLEIGNLVPDERMDDYRKKRVYILIHGNYEDFQNYLTNVQFKDDMDDIIYVWGVQVGQLKEFDFKSFAWFP